MTTLAQAMERVRRIETIIETFCTSGTIDLSGPEIPGLLIRGMTPDLCRQVHPRALDAAVKAFELQRHDIEQGFLGLAMQARALETRLSAQKAQTRDDLPYLSLAGERISKR